MIVLNHPSPLTNYITAYKLIELNISVVIINSLHRSFWCGVSTINFEVPNFPICQPLSHAISDGKSLFLKIGYPKVGLLYRSDELLDYLKTYLVSRNVTFVQNIEDLKNRQYLQFNFNLVDIPPQLTESNITELIWLPNYSQKSDYSISHNRNHINIHAENSFEGINSRFNIVHNFKMADIIVRIVRDLSMKL